MNAREAHADHSWAEFNRQYLTAAIAEVRTALERQTRPNAIPPEHAHPSGSEPALEALVRIFGLTAFERAIILVCAGMELNAAFGPLCAAAHGDPAQPYPTFSLALAALAEPHWSALTPGAPLRRWNLIEVG